MEPASTIPINFNYDKQSDHSLYKLWKLTNDVLYIRCPNISTTERLNNRSWRLLNQRVMKLCQSRNTSGITTTTHSPNNNNNNNSNSATTNDELNDLFKENLKDLKPKTTQFLTERPTLFSHSSNFSLQNRKQSTQTSLESFALEKQSNHVQVDEHLAESDMSDISEISDDDEEEEEVEEEDEQHQDSIVHDGEANISKSGPSPAHIMDSPIESSNIASDNISPQNIQRNQKDTFYLASSSSTSDHHDHCIKPHSSASSHPKSSPLRQVTSRFDVKKNYNSATVASHGNPEQVPLEQPQVQRQNSLFNNFNFKDNSSEILNGSSKPSNQTIDEIDLRRDKGYCSSTDISEDEGLSGDDDDDEDEEEEMLKVKRNKTLTAQSATPSHNVGLDCNSTRNNSTATSSNNVSVDHNSTRKNSTATSNRDDNDSEWVSVYSSSINSTAASAKSIPKNQSLNFTKVEPPSSVLSNETISSMDNRRRNSNSTPLLNKPKSLLSGLFLNEMAHSQSSTPVPVSDKPKLIRSTTTGVLTIDEENKRPSLLFTRKFPSFSDITPLGKRVKSPASTTTTTTTNRTNSSSSISESVHAIDADNSVDSDSTPLKKQGSSVGISDINVSKVPRAKTTVEEEHELLSHSLSKLSRSVSHHSLMSLLSKSSINLSRIYVNSLTKLKPESNNNRYYSSGVKSFESPQSKGSGDLDKSNERVSPIPQQKPSAVEEPTRKHSPSSLTSSSSIPVNSSKLLATPPPSAPSVPPVPKITTTDTSLEDSKKKDTRAQNVNPNEALTAEEKELMENEELSSSLREALLIDHKLGRVAMPDGVMIRKSVVGGDVEDDGVFDDYHAKGW